MTLIVGTRLGPYEVTGRLGAGGMGEVCRATDSRLDREVAIKVLPIVAVPVTVEADTSDDRRSYSTRY